MDIDRLELETLLADFTSDLLVLFGVSGFVCWPVESTMPGSH